MRTDIRLAAAAVGIIADAGQLPDEPVADVPPEMMVGGILIGGQEMLDVYKRQP